MKVKRGRQRKAVKYKKCKQPLYYSPPQRGFLWPLPGTTWFYSRSLFIWLFPALYYKGFIWFVHHLLTRSEGCAKQEEAVNSDLPRECCGEDGPHLLVTGCVSEPSLWGIFLYSFSSVAPKSLSRLPFLISGSSTLASVSEWHLLP